MSEYDLQFQADLEKAQALSLESLALEQFRRQKQISSADNVANIGSVSARRREECDGPPPALPPPPRKPPRGRPGTTDSPRSTGASPTRDESSDLISFASPTSKSAHKDPHASFKEYIEQINKQAEELALNTPEPAPTTMNNHPYNHIPGYSYPPQYAYTYQHPYTQAPYPPSTQTTPYPPSAQTNPYPPSAQTNPYPPSAQTTPYPPSTPYGMPLPVPGQMPPQMPAAMPHYSYYPTMPSHDTTPVYPQMYPPAMQYSQTRMATPTYQGYPPPAQPPPYNYSNTNMISRPPRPAIYPQLNQAHSYPSGPVNTSQAQNINNNNVPIIKNEQNKDKVETKERKTSESNESNDTIGSLPKSMNLIDFGGKKTNSGPGSVRVSVLEAFDPLLTEQSNAEYAGASECSSVYEEYDPLDFLYGETEMRDAPVYATINKRESAMLPSPPPKTIPSVPAVTKRPTTNKLYDCIEKIRTRNFDSEHRGFLKMVLDVRKKFPYTDTKTNPGHVIASRSGGKYPPNTSIKILVHHAHSDEPITFTSDVESTVEHVILTVVCSLEEDIRDDMSGYMLRVWGAKEYFTPGSSLSEYDYVRQCVRLEKDVRLCLHEGKDNELARTERDDARDSHLTLDDLIPTQGATPMLSFDNLSILLETLEGELSRAVGVVGAEGMCSPKAVFQAVKAICALAGGVETLHVTHTLNAFALACTAQGTAGTLTPEIQSDAGPYSCVSLRAGTAREGVSAQSARVRDAVRALLALYTRARLLDFQLTTMPTPPNPAKAVPAHTIPETTLFCIEAVHCLPLCWNHDEYLFHAQVYHGTRPLKGLHLTQSSKIEAAGFYPRIIFDTWVNMEDLPINTLPREARLVLTLYGRTLRTVENQHQNQSQAENDNSSSADDTGDVLYEQTELGWAAIQLFDYDGILASGNYVLALWPARCDRRIPPAPHLSAAPPSPYPVVNIGQYNYVLALWPARCDRRIPPAPHLSAAPPSPYPVVNIGQYNYVLALWPARCDRRIPPAPHLSAAPPSPYPVVNIGQYNYVLALWPARCDRRIPPAPHLSAAPPSPYPVVNIGQYNYVLALWPARCDRRIPPAPHLSAAPPSPYPVVNIGQYNYVLALWPARCDRRIPPAPHLSAAPPSPYPVVNIGQYNYVLALWPARCDRRIPPAPHLSAAPPSPYPVVNIEIPVYAHNGVKWSADDESQELKVSHADLPAFDSLDGHTQSQLLHLIEQGAYQRMPTEGREIMWEKRQYLVELPGALPLVLLAATHWYGEHRAHLLALLKLWQKPSPLNAMHLLLPCFPDSAVRETATILLSATTDDELCQVLPQLTQALRHETYETSPLAELLLSRALSSPAVAHKLFWLLVHSLPNVPQAQDQEFLGINLDEPSGSSCDADASLGAWRYRLFLRALLAVCGENLHRTLVRQQLLVKTLSEVATDVKMAKDGLRQRALVSGSGRVSALLRAEPAALPLQLQALVHDVDVKSCSYFNSNTLPLKIAFIGVDDATIPAMFKVGDDLRQDALVLQVIKVMDSLWLKAGLDLRMVTFQALPTSNQRGMIEIVSEAETLRAIQTEWGLTGSFKDKPIAEWLAKHNPSELEYQRARDNFTASCAGYSVATYLLGICDRHNDNIMLKTSGHLFHIDFGKFLGDAQMFGNFKRDRAPFVLTHDMVYVINGGERPTQRFQHFVELCCMAFNIVRAHHDHLLDLFALMAMSGVGGVTSAAVSYVRQALLPAATSAEAAAAFARLIHSSLKSKFTPINFFLHNLAQMRASGDQSSNTSELLSFMPRTYTMAQEGRLVSVECLGYEKRYDPEKHYVYALRIYRQGQATPAVLYRSYKHFTELYQKICLHFPLAKVHSLPSGLHVGRSNTRQVAERRFGDVQAFLTSLFNLADEIAHSDLVYTFFHPLLRDQQDVEPQRMKNRGESVEAESSGSGSLKLSVQYAGGVLSVLILHAQSLAVTPQGLPPNPYVKVYLVPDPTKETKRKTRVLKRNSHPSFMEMLEYRLPIEVVKSRSLQATVWHYDSLQENQFLGGVVVPLATLPLRQETVAWYPLEYIPR